MLIRPETKYQPFKALSLPDRTWPDRVITALPIWMSTDLRDGNQSLIEPMSVAKKLKLFQHLVTIGFKEIEVAFPSASETPAAPAKASIAWMTRSPRCTRW